MRRHALGLTALAAIALQAPAHSAEVLLDAYAPLVVVGEQSVVAENNLTTMNGTIRGPLFVNQEDGAREDGDVSCTFSLIIDSVDLNEAGKGDCVLTFSDGATVTATASCIGKVGVGCNGTFTVTGGTKRLKGATGSGPVRFQTRSKAYQVTADGDLKETIFGMAFWDDFRFSLP